MRSRHRRRPRWNRAILVAAVLAVLGVVAAVTITTVGGGPGETQRQSSPQGRPAPSPQGQPQVAGPRPSTPVTLPPAGRGHAATPKPTPKATRAGSCPKTNAKPTLTVGAGGRYSTIQAAVDVARAGDTIQIAGGVYRETVTITHSGTASAYLTVQAKPGETVTIEGGNTLPATSSSARGLVTMDGQRYLKLSGLTIANSHRHGIYAGNASNIVIQNSRITHSQDGGVLLGDGSNVVLSCNQVSQNNAAAAGGNIEAAANEGVTLVNVSGFDLVGNRVFDNYEEGIDVKNGTRAGTVRNNDVYRNNGPNIYVDGASDVKISSNRVYGAKGASKSGIGLAVESGGSAQNVDIYNNLIYDNPGGGVDFWIGSYSDVQVFYNTIFDNGRAALRVDSAAVTNSAARGNIAYGNVLSGVTGFTVSGNVTSNPQFVNLAKDDVRLRPGSAAIDAGVARYAPSTDFAGARRPNGRAPDVGAYESG